MLKRSHQPIDVCLQALTEIPYISCVLYLFMKKRNDSGS